MKHTLQCLLDTIGSVESFSDMTPTIGHNGDYMYTEFTYSNGAIVVRLMSFSEKIIVYSNPSKRHKLKQGVQTGRGFKWETVYDPGLNHLVQYDFSLEANKRIVNEHYRTGKYKSISRYLNDSAFMFQQDLLMTLPFDGDSLIRFMEFYEEIKKLALES